MKETIEFFSDTDLAGNVREHILIRREDGSFLTMFKSYWDELEAQKELGGTL